MVAPLVLNRPTRVFARLTHTGENKSAEPVCCDLSRVASILPANPLPKNLTSTHVMSSSSTATSSAPSASRKLLHPSFEASAACKRKRDDVNAEDAHVTGTTTPAAGTQTAPVARESNQAPPAKIPKFHLKPEGQGNHMSQSEGKAFIVAEVSKLLAENEQLKAQNEELRSRLPVFSKQEVERLQPSKQG